MSNAKNIRLLAGLCLLLLTAVLASGCGGDSNDSATTTGTETTSATAVTVDEEIAAAVPDAVKSKGSLTIAVDASYPPNESIAADGTTIEGMDPDLGKALGAVLGLDVKLVNAGFDAIIPGLASGKYDLGMSSFTDTKEREKVVDFVTYFSAGTAFYVKTDGGPDIGSLADLCGHSVGVERGTTQADDATAQSAKCKQDGKSGVTVLVFPDQNAANLSISSGRAEVGMADSPVAAYIAEQSNGQFKLTGELVQHGAVRDRDSQGQRHGATDPRRAEAADVERRLRGDPEEVGRRVGCDHGPDDQRSAQLATDDVRLASVAWRSRC